MGALTGWKFLVNFLLPPPMLLTFLLVIPFPRNVRKGLLIFTNKALSFPVLGGLKLVHLTLILSGVPLVDSGMRTFKSAQEASDHELTPNQRITVLAKKWREERNFWIAAMTFTLWCLLTVLYAQVNHAMRVHDQLDELQAEMDDIKGIKREKPTSKMRVAGAVAAFAHSLGLAVPQRLADAAAGQPADTSNAPPATLPPSAAGFGRFGRGKASEVTEDTTNSTADEVEMTPAGDGTPGPTTRRRAAAAVKAE